LAKGLFRARGLGVAALSSSVVPARTQCVQFMFVAGLRRLAWFQCILRSAMCVCLDVWSLHYGWHGDTHRFQYGEQFAADDGGSGEEEFLAALVGFADDAVAVIEVVE
jgi:hypothetical protein